MALLYVDSMDHYATADLLEKWTAVQGAPTINATGGRRGSQSLRIAGGTAIKGLSPSGATAIIGVAMKISALAAGVRLVGIYDGGTNHDQTYLQLNSDGSIQAFRGGASTGVNAGVGVSLGSSAAGVISAGVVAYLETKIFIHNTLGTVTVRLNGAPILTLINQDTSTGSVVWTAVWLANPTAGTMDYDDLYVLDDAGPGPWNDFLGDCRVDARMPTGPGATTQWTPSAGANWQCVDEIPPNDDTDFNTAATVGLTDTFAVQDAPVVNAIIYGVQQCLSAKKTDAGVASIAPVIRPSGADFVGADLAPGTAYSYLLQIAATNPATGTQWTEAQFNNCEFGVRRTV